MDMSSIFTMTKKTMSKLETHYFECACSSPEHTLRFVLDKTPSEPELYLEVYLHERPFFSRLWYGLKYIFGFKCRYGAWDCWTLSPEDPGRLRNLLDIYEMLEKAPSDKPKGYGTTR